MNKLMKWSKAHTVISLAIVGVGGYFLYKHFYPTTSATGGTTAFTGGNGSYFNASGKK